MKPNSSLLYLLAGAFAGLLQRFTSSGRVIAANTNLFPGMALEPAANLSGGGGVYVANEESITLARAAAANGQIYVGAGNDGNLSGFYLSEPLTQFATDAPDADGLEELLNAIAPPVPTGMRFSFQVHNEAQSHNVDAINDVRRPIGGEFPVVRLTGTETQGRLYNLGLTTFVDDDEGGRNPLVQQQRIQNLLQRIRRAQLVHAISILDAASTDAGSTNWGASTSNPDKNLRTDLRTAKLARGMRSNVVLIGDEAWLARQDAYEQPARTNSVHAARASDTPETLATRLRVARVLIADEVKRTAAATLADIVGSATYNFMADTVATPQDPSNIKQFVMLGAMGAVEVFIEPMTKRTKITVSKYANTQITSTVGIRKRTITYSEG